VDQLSPLSRVGIALADPVRQRILLALLNGPARPSELLVQLSVSKTNLSNHLACLRGCGLIIGTHEGRTITYQLVSADLEHALRDLLRLEARLCPLDGPQLPFSRTEGAS
jgi:ArsR family transcriptional regulator, cadmium/lead-responsive transcriptional repressor